MAFDIIMYAGVPCGIAMLFIISCGIAFYMQRKNNKNKDPEKGEGAEKKKKNPGEKSKLPMKKSNSKDVAIAKDFAKNAADKPTGKKIAVASTKVKAVAAFGGFKKKTGSIGGGGGLKNSGMANVA